MAAKPELKIVPDEKPVLDFSNLSWGDAEEADILSMEAGKAQQAGDIEAVRKAQRGLRLLIARVVVSLPRSWLVKNAPESLAFDDPDTYRHLRRDKMQELLSYYRDPEKVTGE